MTMNTFNNIKSLFQSVFSDILKEDDSYEIGEAALPAYTHKNPLIDWLFWKRIKVAYRFGKATNTPKAILDFGCGSGVLSYLLAQQDHMITSCDVEFRPLNQIKNKIDFPANIVFIESDILDMNMPDESYDIIYALDVLEHIEDLDAYIVLFSKLLKPDGLIIVSGPTENIFYKIGRKIAGNRFTGDYHVTNISKIKAAFQRHMEVKSVKKIQFPIYLFEIFTANN